MFGEVLLNAGYTSGLCLTTYDFDKELMTRNINASSLVNKADELEGLPIEYEPHLVCITEIG